MSELIQKHDSRATIRWKLLTSASAFALTLSSMSVARAEDASHPLIWIELGGQMENVSGQGQVFAPGFLSAYPNSTVLWTGVTPLQAQKPPLFGFGEEGKISFQPENSDWIFAAALRFGRSGTTREVNHQTSRVIHPKYVSNLPSGVQTVEEFADTQIHQKESHAVLDFSAGKDVGLGLFGNGGSSVLNFGVRFAQFTSTAAFDIRARPDLQVKYVPSAHATPLRLLIPYFHTYHATGRASREFHGVGPSLSWNGSAPFAGNTQDGEIALDWGVNAALLFGRQKARVQHQESAHYVTKFDINRSYYLVYQHPPTGHSTDRSIMVPNAGGSLGISFRKGDAKVSFGYRADFFFGAMDTGIDARKTSNLTFNGPYASISVGLGD